MTTSRLTPAVRAALKALMAANGRDGGRKRSAAKTAAARANARRPRPGRRKPKPA
jgi:hypothetical protein